MGHRKASRDPCAPKKPYIRNARKSTVENSAQDSTPSSNVGIPTQSSSDTTNATIPVTAISASSSSSQHPSAPSPVYLNDTSSYSGSLLGAQPSSLREYHDHD